MKTQRFITKILLLSLVSVFGVGCAKDGGSGLTINSGAGTGVYTGGTPSSSLGGATVAFAPDSLALMTEYVASHPLNNPQNIKLSVSTRDVGNGRYAGTLQLSYTDNGSTYTGTFDSGSGTYQISPSPYTGKSEAEFNQWFVWGGQRVFHGFFQDKYGAVMLVIDQSLDLGDGGPLTNLSGSFWFKNFTQTTASQPAAKCWFIWAGPYNCQAFVVNGVVQTSSGLYPTDGYKRLGTFTGLNPRAFGM